MSAARAPGHLGRGTGIALALVCGLCADAHAQGGRRVASNHPSTDPYTRGEAAALERAGLASLGGFEFATTDTAEIDEFMGVSDIKWIESAHFEIGFALGPYRVPQKEKKAIAAELLALQEKLPEINPKASTLDPWLRAHMYAQRAERVWDRFLELIDVDASVFPTGEASWTPDGEYWGIGPHLGQKGKYEVLILPSEGASVMFLQQYFGLKIKRTQRWNVLDRDSLVLVIHTRQGRLVEDTALHGHLAFNLTHNLLDGYKHYSYDTPIWLHEGLAHFIEREINPRHNTFDGSEGAVPEMTRKSRWGLEVKKLIAGGDAPRMAELMSLDNYGQMELADHFATWSMVDFLTRTEPKGFAALLGALKGFRDEQGVPDGSDLSTKHRRLFKELLGYSYAEFDAAWKAWAKGSY
ncbi:MAG: hypothetical protein QF903_10120 [Planctomycetota bacterium]|jgi:hypothetical protein|nr:hypothetical protein [Planctomycetota bacterium]MDP6989822.1 hypothetical protein [Planctomycetota bacterium]